MGKTTFGERLRIAFNNATNAQIADKIEVGRSTVVNYLAGRIPEWDIVLRIKKVTGCDLDWLLTGDESRLGTEAIELDPRLDRLLRSIAREQSSKIWPDLDIAAKNLEERTLSLLVEFLLVTGMERFGLVAMADIMHAADAKRTERFTFVANAPQRIEDQIREMISREVLGKSVSSVAQEDEIRDMIRAIVRDEIEQSRKAPLVEIDFGHGDAIDKKTRKAG